MKIQKYLNVFPVVLLLNFTFCFLAEAQDNLPALVKKIQSSVVMIITYGENDSALLQGTGFFINSKGDVISNKHVFEGATRAIIKASDGKTYNITKYLAVDINGDLVMVSVDIPKKLVHPLKVSSIVPAVGEKIVVIGNPNGFEQTVSDGIVSAVRAIPDFGNIIQITAPVSHGSSGSPVVNMNGIVIGVATLISTEGQNLNFAVPGERVAKLKPDTTKKANELKAGILGDSSTSAQAIYEKGRNFLWAADYKKALSFFEQAVKINPLYFEAYFEIGMCNAYLGQYQVASDAFKQVILLKPDMAISHISLGMAYEELGRYQEAIDAYKQAIRLKPDDASAHYSLGVAYAKFGQYQEAIDASKQAIRLKPDYADAHITLGVAYDKLGQYQEAIDAYKQAIRFNPDDASAHINLGMAYDELGRYQEAIDAYKQTIRLNPDDAGAHINLGVDYDELKQYQEAIDAYKQAIRLNPDYADAHYNVGKIYFELKRYQEAIDAFKQAIRLKPDDAGTHRALGVVYIVSGD